MVSVCLFHLFCTLAGSLRKHLNIEEGGVGDGDFARILTGFEASEVFLRSPRRS